MTNSAIHISLDTFNVTCTAEEVAATFAWLLEEMRAATPRLRPDEREVLRRIMARPSGTYTVGDLFPNFTREGEPHKTLRRLRAAQFIRPARTGRWETGEPVEVKPFGRLVWDKLGEAAVFGDPAEDADDEVDLSLPEVNDPEFAETVRVRSKGVEDWNDEDVLDFLKDETKG